MDFIFGFICGITSSIVMAGLSSKVLFENSSKFWKNLDMLFIINSITISLAILFIAPAEGKNNIVSEIASRFGWEIANKYIYFVAFLILITGILISKIYYKNKKISDNRLELIIISLYCLGAIFTIISFFIDKIPFEAVFCSLSTFICLDVVINNFFQYKDL